MVSGRNLRAEPRFTKQTATPSMPAAMPTVEAALKEVTLKEVTGMEVSLKDSNLLGPATPQGSKELPGASARSARQAGARSVRQAGARSARRLYADQEEGDADELPAGTLVISS